MLNIYIPYFVGIPIAEVKTMEYIFYRKEVLKCRNRTLHTADRRTHLTSPFTTDFDRHLSNTFPVTDR